MLFKAELITYYGVYDVIETDKLNVPTSEGRRTILSNHSPIMLTLEIGVMETSKDNKLSHYAINGGVLFFKDNQAQLVLNNVINVDKIVIDNVMKEIEKVNLKIKKAKNENELIRAQYQLEVAQNQLNAANKYQNHK